MCFRSRGLSESLSPFILDTSLKCIDREGLGRRRTGTRQVVRMISTQILVTDPAGGGGGVGAGGRSSRTLNRGGAGLQKKFFLPFVPQFGLKIRGEDLACSTGFPSPPFLTGSASSSHSLVVHVWPVIDCVRTSLLARSGQCK